MGAHLRVATGLTVLMLGASTGAAQLNSPGTIVPDQAESSVLQDRVTTQTFLQRVEEYAALHRMLEAALPALRTTTDVEEILANTRLLASRIKAVRQHAREGAVFTPDVGRLIRRRIATCLTPEQWHEILAELAETEQGVPVPAVRLHVNMAWPEDVPFGFVPPSLLAALPQLPPELEFRILGRSLVLWDHHANLIVDFLPAAFTT